MLISTAHQGLFPLSTNIIPKAIPMNTYPGISGTVHRNAFFSVSTVPPILLVHRIGTAYIKNKGLPEGPGAGFQRSFVRNRLMETP